jgi:hypothetical protein
MPVLMSLIFKLERYLMLDFFLSGLMLQLAGFAATGFDGPDRAVLHARQMKGETGSDPGPWVKPVLMSLGPLPRRLLIPFVGHHYLRQRLAKLAWLGNVGRHVGNEAHPIAVILALQQPHRFVGL